LKAIGKALITPAIWSVVGFMLLWALNPGFLNPLTIYMKETLGFGKGTIGLLRGLQAFGGLVGALVYMRYLTHRYSVKQLAFWLIVAGATTQLAYVLLNNVAIAVVLFFIYGAVGSAVAINAHAIAARRCPDGAEGTVYATLLAVTSMGWTSSDWVGSYLFDNYLHQTIFWLVVASAMLTLSCLLFVWKFDFDKTGES
jgi:predicted MFS family arabinose efflux permease